MQSCFDDPTRITSIIDQDLYALLCLYNRRQCYQEDALLEQDSITCKLCNAKFDSLGDTQRHVLTEHMQKRLRNSDRKSRNSGYYTAQ